MLSRIGNLFRLQYDYSDNPSDYYRAIGLFILSWINVVLYAGWVYLVAWPALTEGTEDSQIVVFALVGGLALLALSFFALQTGRLYSAVWAYVVLLGAAVVPPVLSQFNSEPLSLATPVLLLLPVVAAGLLLPRRHQITVTIATLALIVLRALLQTQSPETLEIIPEEAARWDAIFLGVATGLTFLLLFLFSGYAERVLSASRHDLAVLRGVNAYASAVAASRSEQALMILTLDYIRDRLEYRSAQLFLLDEEGALVRRVQSGLGAREVGAGMIVSEVDREIVAAAARSNEPLIVTHRDENSSHLIPPARSAISVAVRSENRVFGILNVHSIRPRFSPDEKAALVDLASQFAVMLAQQREFDNLQRALRDQAEARALTARPQRTPALTAPGRIVGFDFYPGDSGPVLTPMSDLPPYIAAALEQLEPFIEARGDVQHIHVPIRFRGETLGAMTFTLPRNQPIGDRQMALIRTVSDRLAQALENMWLFEQTQAQAFRERKATEVANMLIGATDVRSVLERAAETFNEALGAVSTRITLQPNPGEDRVPRARGELT
ncbi:MAG: GAF domain-containing protein [Chloroflexota bacterium]